MRTLVISAIILVASHATLSIVFGEAALAAMGGRLPALISIPWQTGDGGALTFSPAYRSYAFDGDLGPWCR